MLLLAKSYCIARSYLLASLPWVETTEVTVMSECSEVAAAMPDQVFKTYSEALSYARKQMPDESETIISNVAESLFIRSQRSATPGPWRYEASTKTIRSVPANYWLATMNSWDGAVNHAANAKLIAAAPEMLEALRQIATGNVMDGKTDFSHGDVCVAYQQIAQAAYLKAVQS